MNRAAALARARAAHLSVLICLVTGFAQTAATQGFRLTVFPEDNAENREFRVVVD